MNIAIDAPLQTPTAQLAAWVETLGERLAQRNVDATLELFADECYWRDLLLFSWNLVTLEGKPAIRDLLETRLEQTRPQQWKLDGEATLTDGVLEGWMSLETEAARGKGYVRLKDGLCWTLLTTMRELKGFEEPSGRRRPMGATHGHAHADKRNWLERRRDEQAALGITTQPYCLIVGGGQGGLGLAARLKRLGVPTLIVDKAERPGDQWRGRYKSLCLHDPVWYDHMPYLPFPDHWPVFTPKDQIGDWLEMYSKVMELDYWSRTECLSAGFDEQTQTWTVEVLRDGEHLTLKPTQLILATGMSGVPNVPRFPGADVFQGQQHHSSRHPGGDAWRGKRAVVIGANNSAHDICADLVENGAEVTMVQRSSTHIVRSDSLMELVFGGLYSEDALEAGLTTDKADMLFASIPYKVMPSFHKPIFDAIKTRDKDFYERLAKAGFMLDFGDDESGLFLKYVRRGSGYYIDVGASELIANGTIKLKSAPGLGVDHIEADAVVLTDGSRLAADLIVYATGYGSMNGWAAKLISQEVADKVGRCWGLGSGTTNDPGPYEGELRNMWKPTRQDNLWFHGGNLHQSRHYSLYLALQLKARFEGLGVGVYQGSVGQ
ncbi:putative flavoprotein involved in K+ transport [Pseudomonas sp. Z003-0.4C(8344-21)]|uniref:NAD(P)/FAD-dependent oxidoreductase n=1 Tax=Pseudomonas sp. Z003-0.4C(8344-21) TaxID=1855380 RepID=UPI00087A61A7|nr:NAD(P)/FAD-dependent oxidoreductase [Pseudomonas sp. Z003-0.4C(8344-21)]SDT06399.1 putative flavoprotein involved in K+ transport [Pseudomonas sp. Z003-0.4C(8344-21)]